MAVSTFDSLYGWMLNAKQWNEYYVIVELVSWPYIGDTGYYRSVSACVGPTLSYTGQRLYKKGTSALLFLKMRWPQAYACFVCNVRWCSQLLIVLNELRLFQSRQKGEYWGSSYALQLTRNVTHSCQKMIVSPVKTISTCLRAVMSRLPFLSVPMPCRTWCWRRVRNCIRQTASWTIDRAFRILKRFGCS